MNVCAEVATDSTFPNTVEGFSRFLGHPSGTRILPPLHEPTTSKALAGALLELAKISNGSLRSVTFQGGIDCAWLTAVSQWLLNLRVEIIDAYGVCLYSNVIPNSDLHAQVIIIQNSSDTAHENEAKALSRPYFVSPGQLCFSLLAGVIAFRLHQYDEANALAMPTQQEGFQVLFLQGYWEIKQRISLTA
jgi:hypothetical protein